MPADEVETLEFGAVEGQRCTAEEEDGKGQSDHETEPGPTGRKLLAGARLPPSGPAEDPNRRDDPNAECQRHPAISGVGVRYREGDAAIADKDVGQRLPGLTRCR